ncbi:hypothetical protein VTK26DRAFT_8002 [Humicola hyalothermophila]
MDSYICSFMFPLPFVSAYAFLYSAEQCIRCGVSARSMDFLFSLSLSLSIARVAGAGVIYFLFQGMGEESRVCWLEHLSTLLHAYIQAFLTGGGGVVVDSLVLSGAIWVEIEKGRSGAVVVERTVCMLSLSRALAGRQQDREPTDWQSGGLLGESSSNGSWLAARKAGHIHYGDSLELGWLVASGHEVSAIRGVRTPLVVD